MVADAASTGFGGPRYDPAVIVAAQSRRQLLSCWHRSNIHTTGFMSSTRPSAYATLVPRAKYSASRWIGRRERLYRITTTLLRRRRGLYPHSATDLVIAGVARCANSYVYWTVQMANSDRLAIAHHLHVPAVVIRAVELRIPTLVLTRDPIDVAVSMLARNPELPPTAVLRDYVSFYASIWSLRDHYVVADFAAATSDLDGVVGRLNSRYLSDFGHGPSSEDADSRVFSRILGAHGPNTTTSPMGTSVPSIMRDRAKPDLRNEVLRRARPETLDAARAWYKALRSASQR